MNYQTSDGFYIPARMLGAIKRYVEMGEIPGDFLQAVICNDLKESCGRADSDNLRNLPAYASYFYNEAPSKCWGSREKMLAWSDSVAGKLPPPGMFKLYERYYKIVAEFKDGEMDQANAFMAANPGAACLAVEDGRIILADKKDRGVLA